MNEQLSIRIIKFAVPPAFIVIGVYSIYRMFRDKCYGRPFDVTTGIKVFSRTLCMHHVGELLLFSLFTISFVIGVVSIIIWAARRGHI